MMSEQPPRDHAPEGAENDPDETDGRVRVEENIKARSTWLRLLFMIIIVIIYGISRLVVGAVVLLQFFRVLFTGETNLRLTAFGQSLAIYTYQIVRYLTFNTDTRPFPFDEDWPSQHAAEDGPGGADDA